MKKLSEKQKENIAAKIDWEGFEYWAENWGEEMVKETELEPLLKEYLNAKNRLEEKMEELGIFEYSDTGEIEGEE